MPRFSARIRPGGKIHLPRPILIALGWVPGEAMEVTIEIRGNRLFVAKKPAAGEAKLSRFKARLAERLRRLRLGSEDADWNAAWGGEERDRLTHEALADVDAGRVIDHQAVRFGGPPFICSVDDHVDLQ